MKRLLPKEYTKMTTMLKIRTKFISICCISLMYTACVPSLVHKEANKSVPKSFNNSQDSTNSANNTAKVNWKNYFNDPYLTTLIDSALQNNQDLNYMIQEIAIAKNEVKARKGAYLPFVGIGARAGVDKVGTYTSQGASDAADNITPNQRVPSVLPNYLMAVTASWEIDIWKKLRNARKSAVFKYLSTNEGKNFMVTNLVADIANAYYELMALDNQLEILQKNIEIQENALEIVKLEKMAARVTELAVRKFEAEVLKNQSRQYYIVQQITEIQNTINFLVGRFPQPVARNSPNFTTLALDTIRAGIPSQLLENRTDIKQAELQLAAAELDIKVMKANFYPSLVINAGIGYQAFNPRYLLTTPESIIFGIGGDIVAPLINRNAIKAAYLSANARQVQAVYMYQRTILRAHIEVVNQLSNIDNLDKSYQLRAKQVQALTESIEISNGLFRSARATYMEILLTQRDALESKFQLTETKRDQLHAKVNIYRALGGGW